MSPKAPTFRDTLEAHEMQRTIVLITKSDYSNVIRMRI